MHVDDTFIFIPTPKVAEFVGIKEGAVTLHPTLPAALEGRAGAAEDFREWLRDLASTWDVKNLCAAHSGNLLEVVNTGEGITVRMVAAMTLAEPVLCAHEGIYGKTAKL